MTVADLIRELQAMPNQHAPVRLVQRQVYVSTPMGPDLQSLGIEDSSLVDEIRFEGSFVLIEGP